MVDYILPPLVSLVQSGNGKCDHISENSISYTFCFHSISMWSRSWHFVFFQVEWRLFSLRLLSETTSLLVNQEVGDGKKEANVDSDSSLLALIRDVLLPQ